MPTITLKTFSDCLHTSYGVFPSEETSWEISKGSVVTHCRRYFHLVSGAQASRERPSPCSSAFIHQSAWIPPPSPSWDPHRQEADQNQQADPQERASHSHVPMGCVQKSWSGKGSPRQAGGDGDDQGRRVTHAQSRCRDSRAGARTHGPELPILFTLRFSSAAGSGIRFENRLQLQNPQGGPRKKKKIPRCPRNQSESCTCLQAASAEQTGLRDQRGPGPLLPSGLATRLARSHLQAQRA